MTNKHKHMLEVTATTPEGTKEIILIEIPAGHPCENYNDTLHEAAFQAAKGRLKTDVFDYSIAIVET